jgi:hypothetical protein
MRKVEAQICLQCGSMSWLVISSGYVGEYRVREDGHVEFIEDFRELEYVCNECGGHSLLGVKGTPKVYCKLIRLQPMQRILAALENIVDGTLEVTDEVDLDEVMELIECFRDRWTMLHKDEESLRAVEDFMSRVEKILGKWKLLAENP